MKQTPREEMIQERLKPGVVTLEGFLGGDSRHFHDIINDDLRRLKELRIEKEQIAGRMQYLTDKAFLFADEEGLVDGIFKVTYLTERGKIMSPFMDNSFHPKGIIKLENTNNNLTVSWTPLSIYMIGKYGFFEGQGAKHRLNPETLIKAIFNHDSLGSHQ